MFQPIYQNDLITPSSYQTHSGLNPVPYPLPFGAYQELQPSSLAYQNHHMDISNSNSVDVIESAMASATCPLQQDHPGGILPTTFGPYNTSGMDEIYPCSIGPTASIPDILPIRESLDEPKTPPCVASESKSVNDELVGMGLYDEPETLPVWDYSLTRLSGVGGTDAHVAFVHRSTGKGLKLEETFDPSTVDKEGEEEEPEEEESDGEEKEEDRTTEEPRHQTDQGSAKVLNEKVHIADNEPWLVTQNDVSIYEPGLKNSSFFFENEDDSGLDISTSHHLLALPQNMTVSHCGFQYGWI
jgi:hypothetical protein